MKETSRTPVNALRYRYRLRARIRDGSMPIEPSGRPNSKYVFCVLKADLQIEHQRMRAERDRGRSDRRTLRSVCRDEET